jgi:hypothetical protein
MTRAAVWEALKKIPVAKMNRSRRTLYFREVIACTLCSFLDLFIVRLVFQIYEKEILDVVKEPASFVLTQ